MPMPTHVPAIWHDGQSAAAHAVLLAHHAEAGTLLVLAAKKGQEHSRKPISGPDGSLSEPSLPLLAVWPLDDIRVLSGGLAPKAPPPVRLALEPDDGRRLVLHDPVSVAAVASWYAGPQKAQKKRTLQRWVYATVGVWLFCIGLYAASPLLFSMAAAVIPRSWEEDLGESARDTVIEALSLMHSVRGKCDKGSKSPDLAALMQRLERAAPVNGYTFEITVLDANFVNAFALPGGYILVTTGLIKDCTSPDELAGVLAHEMAHVTRRHGTSRMLRQYVWSAVVNMTGGSTSGVMGNLALMVVTSGFDRDDEREADHLGSLRLVGAGVTPEALGTFFTRLQKQEAGKSETGLLSYLGSHPDLAERMENVRKSVAEARKEAQGKTLAPILDAESWQRLRAACAR